jgi:hypothetical protein
MDSLRAPHLYSLGFPFRDPKHGVYRWLSPVPGLPPSQEQKNQGVQSLRAGMSSQGTHIIGRQMSKCDRLLFIFPRLHICVEQAKLLVSVVQANALKR